MNINGLQNIGNTCYLNSALQVLINCTILTKFVLNNEFNSEGLKIYKKFLHDYFTNKISTPDKLKIYVSKKHDRFTGGRQHDAHDFMISLMDILNDEFIEEHKINPKSILNIDMKDLMDTLFDTATSSIIYCDETNEKTKNRIGEKILSVPLPDKNNVTIFDCLKEFSKIEKLDGDNKWYSEKNKKYYDVYKRLYIRGYPKYLIIHIKRFTHFGFTKKNNKSVMADETLQLNDSTYTLRGMVNHMGNSGGGHYISLIKEDNKWFCCNDSNVSEEHNIDRYINNSYIYLYVRSRN